MKKLSINKMNEFPTINLDEQKMIKGGGENPLWDELRRRVGEWVLDYIIEKGVEWVDEHKEELADARKRAMERHRAYGGTMLDMKF